MKLRFAPFLLFLALAGCVSPGATLDPASKSVNGAAFDTTRGWSTPLSPPVHEILEGVKLHVESFDGTPISVGLFFPEIEGCDWEAEALPEECRLPVVLDSGPYYADHIEVQKYRPPITEWLVPRGYVSAHMSVRGTGESGGCMEFMSVNEQKDVDHVVTWLATQPWSTGSVGMMGRSYDGTTPFMAAAMGNPHLKTIVPISGVASVPDLMFKNGTSESRGPIMHSVVYWAFYGVGASDGGATAHRADQWRDQACQELVLGQAHGAAATATGDVNDDYWQVREFRDRILENYNGSVWIIHGREDWNVNPSQVVPWINELQDAGIKTKAWLGVWGHAYPDRVDEHRNVRWDWAEQTVRWFDSELKGLPVDTGPAVEVEDSLFVWRAEESYPPRDATWWDVPLNFGGDSPIVPNSPSYTMSEPLESAVRIAGLPRFHATFTPTATGTTYAFAELYDVFPDGRQLRIGWAAINLQYADGGNTEMTPLVPGQSVLAKMEFEPVDALVAEGHRLRLVVHMDGVEDILASPSAAPIVLDWGASVLSLPTVDRPNLLPTYVPPGLEGSQ